MLIENLYPNKVFHYFKEVSAIPRGSKHEKGISDYCVKFAKERNLDVYQDENYNIIIRKPATKGYEEYKTLVIQGHLDMVWEKKGDVEFNFETQGIRLFIEDGYITAKGTTLGADNGIGIALGLAILDSDELQHPSLEILFTTEEESSMNGAEAIDVNELKGRTILNIDTEEYGKIYVSSAGGSRVTTAIEKNIDEIDNSANVYSIELKGLSGGHSGVDINTGAGNSINILANMMKELYSKKPFRIISFNGGDKDNAIPRESKIIIETKEDIENDIANLYEKYAKPYLNRDKNMIYVINKVNRETNDIISLSDTKEVLDFITEHKTGVVKMSDDIDGLVQTSLNFGVLRMTKNEGKIKIALIALVRSSSVEELKNTVEELNQLSKKYSGSHTKDGEYHPWEYAKISGLRDLLVKSWEELTGEKAELTAIHAGLECGIFTEKMPDADVVSIGPTILNAHTPDEMLEIEAVGKTWDYLVDILKKYNLK